MPSKQGYALKNWVEGLSKKFELNWTTPTFATEQNEVSIDGNLRIFQNHRKQAKINESKLSFVW